MTTQTNNVLIDNKSLSSFSVEEAPQGTRETAILSALAKASNSLDTGKLDDDAFQSANALKDVLILVLSDNSESTPAIPTVLIPKLFAWVKIYGLNALYTMPGSMLDNSSAIQSYIADGLNKLSEVVMNDSQLWSAYGLQRLNVIQAEIETLTKQIVADKGTVPGESTQLNTASNAFNLENTYYQKNLELCSTTNTGLNQTSSSTTQTQTLNNQNITQGPLAMMQILVGIWQVIA
jgi:hypothetical protein